MRSICGRCLPRMRQLFLRFNNIRFVSTTDETVIYDPISNEPQIPTHIKIRHESIDVKRKRLLYQSRKRGILENDLILSTFADKYLNGFDKKQLELYDFIINMPSNDWELYYWSVGRKQVPEEYNNEIMDLLVKHTRNKDKQSRIRQPDI